MMYAYFSECTRGYHFSDSLQECKCLSDFRLYELFDKSQFMSRPRILKILSLYFLLSGFDSFASSKICASLLFRYSLIGCKNIVSGLLFRLARLIG